MIRRTAIHPSISIPIRCNRMAAHVSVRRNGLYARVNYPSARVSRYRNPSDYRRRSETVIRIRINRNPTIRIVRSWRKSISAYRRRLRIPHAVSVPNRSCVNGHPYPLSRPSVRDVCESDKPSIPYEPNRSMYPNCYRSESANLSDCMACAAAARNRRTGVTAQPTVPTVSVTRVVVYPLTHVSDCGATRDMRAQLAATGGCASETASVQQTALTHRLSPQPRARESDATPTELRRTVLNRTIRYPSDPYRRIYPSNRYHGMAYRITTACAMRRHPARGLKLSVSDYGLYRRVIGDCNRLNPNRTVLSVRTEQRKLLSDAV